MPFHAWGLDELGSHDMLHGSHELGSHDMLRGSHDLYLHYTSLENVFHTKPVSIGAEF